MAKRKYQNYIVATEFAENDYSTYSDALTEYHYAESATLYGETFEGELSVIFAK